MQVGYWLIANDKISTSEYNLGNDQKYILLLFNYVKLIWKYEWMNEWITYLPTLPTYLINKPNN
jgi:hypothetical protein